MGIRQLVKREIPERNPMEINPLFAVAGGTGLILAGLLRGPAATRQDKLRKAATATVVLAIVGMVSVMAIRNRGGDPFGGVRATVTDLLTRRTIKAA